MAEYRQIHTRIWKDDWFSELPLDAKILFIYLFSNEQAEVGGVYELPIKYMSFETGVSQGRIAELISEFEIEKKVYYRNGWVWVVNLRKYNESGSNKVAIRIEKDLASLPDGELKEMYCKYYKIPYRYPIDTLSIPVCTETETETEKETDTESRAFIFSHLDSMIGCPTGGHSDIDTAEIMLNEYGEDRFKMAAAWAKEKTFSTMRTALRSMNTALSNNGFKSDKSNGHKGATFEVFNG